MNQLLSIHFMNYIKMLKKEWLIFNHAIIFFTRIPIQQSFEYQKEYERKALRYIPLVGGIVGLSSSIIFLISYLFFSLEISVFFSMLMSIVLTGAIHEDGFADFCDSMGGMTPEKRLEIMKDSTIGTFGVIGLVGSLLGKFLFLTHIPPSQMAKVIISGHVLSRLSVIFIMQLLPYAGIKRFSKSLTLTETDHSINLYIACVITAFFFIYFSFLMVISIIVISIIIVYLYYFFKKTIGGYTGDYLGATQQLSELTHYLVMILIYQYIDCNPTV